MIWPKGMIVDPSIIKYFRLPISKATLPFVAVIPMSEAVTPPTIVTPILGNSGCFRRIVKFKAMAVGTDKAKAYPAILLDPISS